MKWVQKSRNPIKGAKGATNNAYFTEFSCPQIHYRPLCMQIAIFFLKV